MKTLAAIMVEPSAPAAARVAAANAILDRGWGKATQTVEFIDKTPDIMTDAELLEAIRAASMAGSSEAPEDKSLLN